MQILKLDGLCKQYPAFRLENVSFSMEAGTIMGLIGRNGAGKTTTLKSMLHLVHPDAGTVTICGLDMDKDEREIRSRIGFVSGGAHIFGHEIRAIFEAFEKGDNEKARELFVPLYRFCKSCGQNGRILPNSIMRPAIELVTGIPVGPARSPLAPITDEEMAVLKQVLKEVGKL